MSDQKKEAEAYSSYLRTKMGESLTDAVAQVIAKRPRDPIEYLATSLYRSRSMLTPSVQDARTRRLQMTSWTPGETGSAIPLPDIRLARRELRHMTTEIVPGPSRSVHKSTDSRTNVGHVLDSMDDADEDYDLGIPTVYVHQEVLSLFTLIGDVFDDDKVS